MSPTSWDVSTSLHTPTRVCCVHAAGGLPHLFGVFPAGDAVMRIVALTSEFSSL